MAKLHLKTALLILCASMAACSSVPYKEPVDGPTANVRFAMVAPAGSEKRRGPIFGLSVYRYANSSCEGEDKWLNLRSSGLYNDPMRSLNMPLNTYKNSAAKEVKVLANTEIYFLFKSDRIIYNFGTTSCGVPLAAKFTAGGNYEILFTESKYGDCGVEFSEIVASGSSFKKQEITKVDNSITDKFSGCREAFEKTRWW